MASVQEGLRILQADQSLLQSIPRVIAGARQTGDLHRVLGFGQLQRTFRVDPDRLVVRPVHGISAAAEQFILRVYLLNRSRRVVPDEVLHHHNIAGLGDREIGFRGDDQTKHLKFGGREKLGVIPA